MLLLLHAIIPGFAAYILRFGLRILLLLHALNPCIVAYTAIVSLLFGTVIPTSFNIFMEMCYILVSLIFRCILACKCNTLGVSASPIPFAARGHTKCT